MFLQVLSFLLILQCVGNCLALNPEIRISKNCVNVHPALLDQARGYELAVHAPGGPRVRSLQKPLSPVFQFTCNQNKTYKNPFKTTRYQIPDQLDVMGLPAGKMSRSSRCYDSTTSINRAVYSEIDRWEKFGLGSFTSTDGLSNATLTVPPSAKCLIRISRILYALEARVSTPYDLARSSSPLPAPEFNESFYALPETTNPDPSTYAKFMQEYGTGYFQKAFYANALDLWVFAEVSVKDGFHNVDAMLTSFKNSTEADVGKWIKRNVETLFPGANPTVFVRHSSPGRWSEEAVNLVSGTLVTFGERQEIVLAGPKLDNLEAAIKSRLTNSGLKMDWRGDWDFDIK